MWRNFEWILESLNTSAQLKFSRTMRFFPHVSLEHYISFDLENTGYETFFSGIQCFEAKLAKRVCELFDLRFWRMSSHASDKMLIRTEWFTIGCDFIFIRNIIEEKNRIFSKKSVRGMVSASPPWVERVRETGGWVHGRQRACGYRLATFYERA